MWSNLATVEACHPCQPPFSFYFEIVGLYWKTRASNSHPLHRFCTLARKQGATFVVVESALDWPEVREEIDALDASLGGGGAADAVAIAFFDSDTSPENIADVDEANLLGQVVVINYRAPMSTEFTHSYIYDAVFSAPLLSVTKGVRKALLNNYIFVDRHFRRTVRGRVFTLLGIYYCQQNSQTHVCAHACLRMALNSLGLCDPPITSQRINALIGAQPPFAGLELGQIAQVIDSVDGVTASIYDCSGLEPANYLSILTSVLKSGDVALLVFTTGHGTEHVVTVFGYTRNSDEWHPQAIPAYAGPQSARYFPSSAWIDHFLIHDDNFGPYYALSSRALETDQSVQPHWIIALHPVRPNVRPDYAETIAAIVLSSLLPTLAPVGGGRWFEYITQHQWTYVLRTILIEKPRYIEHLRGCRAHDQSTFSASDISLLAGFPDHLWMVEFSLPALYTGNRSKLGEVILDAQAAPAAGNPLSLVVGLRLPGMLLLRDASGGFTVHKVGVNAHVPVYLHRGHDHEW